MVAIDIGTKGVFGFSEKVRFRKGLVGKIIIF